MSPQRALRRGLPKGTCALCSIRGPSAAPGPGTAFGVNREEEDLGLPVVSETRLPPWSGEKVMMLHAQEPSVTCAKVAEAEGLVICSGVLTAALLAR